MVCRWKTCTDLTFEGLALLSQEKSCFLSYLVWIWTHGTSLILLEELLVLEDFLHFQGFLSPSLSCTPGAPMPGHVRINGDSGFSNARLPEGNKMYGLGRQNTQSFLVKCGFQLGMALSLKCHKIQNTRYILFSTMTRYLLHQSNSLEPWIAADIFLEQKHYGHMFLKLTILIHNNKWTSLSKLVYAYMWHTHPVFCLLLYAHSSGTSGFHQLIFPTYLGTIILQNVILK